MQISQARERERERERKLTVGVIYTQTLIFIPLF